MSNNIRIKPREKTASAIAKYTIIMTPKQPKEMQHHQWQTQQANEWRTQNSPFNKADQHERSSIAHVRQPHRIHQQALQPTSMIRPTLETKSMPRNQNSKKRKRKKCPGCNQRRRWYPSKGNKPRITTITRKQQRWGRSGSVDCGLGLGGARIRLGSEGREGEGRGVVRRFAVTHHNNLRTLCYYHYRNFFHPPGAKASGNGFCSPIFLKYATSIMKEN